jgi:hypothetical protein
MLQYGLIALESGSDEILETAKEAEEIAGALARSQDGTMIEPTDSPAADGLLDTWRASLGLPHFYGNAQPSRYYLQKYASEFLRD